MSIYKILQALPNERNVISHCLKFSRGCNMLCNVYSCAPSKRKKKCCRIKVSAVIFQHSIASCDSLHVWLHVSVFFTMSLEQCIVTKNLKMKNVITTVMTTEEMLELAHDKGKESLLLIKLFLETSQLHTWPHGSTNSLYIFYLSLASVKNDKLPHIPVGRKWWLTNLKFANALTYLKHADKLVPL